MTSGPSLRASFTADPQGTISALRESIDTKIAKQTVTTPQAVSPIGEMTKKELKEALRGVALTEDQVHELMRARLSDTEYQMYLEDRVAAQNPDKPNAEAASRAFDTEWSVLKQEYGYAYNKKELQWIRLSATGNRILEQLGKKPAPSPGDKAAEKQAWEMTQKIGRAS